MLPILLHFLADAALVEEAQRNGYVSYNIANTKGYVQRAKELSGIWKNYSTNKEVKPEAVQPVFFIFCF